MSQAGLLEEVLIEDELGPLARKGAPALGGALVDGARVVLRWLEHAVQDGLDFIGERLAIALFESEPSRQAFFAFFRELGHAFNAHYVAVALLAFVTLLLLLMFLVGPLLATYISRPSAIVFVSFNSALASDAKQVQKSLQARGMGASRVPYSPSPDHQELLAAIFGATRKAHLCCCVPGLHSSFVDSEVAILTGSRKPVVFLLSEVHGTLPNTADKRYPVFKLEPARAATFAPVVDFLRYIGADFVSQLELVKRSRVDASCFFGSRKGAAMVVATFLAAALYSYFSVYGRGVMMASSYFSPGEEQLVAAAANACLFGILGLVALVVFEYVSAVLLNRRRQVRTQRLAALEVAGATFSRDEWLGRVPGLQVGSPMYECLFEAPAFAHHEKETRAQDA